MWMLLLQQLQRPAKINKRTRGRRNSAPVLLQEEK